MLNVKTLRGALVAAALGAACGALVAPLVLPAFVLPAWAQTKPASGISIDNFTFGPAKLTVKAGTTVTWTNKDDIPHGIASADNAFTRSKALDTDDAFSFTFTTPGTYQYFCYIHPHMVGTIVVEAATGENTTP
jgi:plastocyanin